MAQMNWVFLDDFGGRHRVGAVPRRPYGTCDGPLQHAGGTD
jgi:hypothetical protein